MLLPPEKNNTGPRSWSLPGRRLRRGAPRPRQGGFVSGPHQLPSSRSLAPGHLAWGVTVSDSVTSCPSLTTLQSEGGTVHSSPPGLLSSSQRDGMVRKSTSMRSWRMGRCEIADFLSPLLCTKTTFHSLGKIQHGPSWRNGLPQDSCLLSSRLGGQARLTQMPPL